jgi:hypothetical protein
MLVEVRLQIEGFFSLVDASAACVFAAFIHDNGIGHVEGWGTP